jgi:hypothetical protein
MSVAKKKLRQKIKKGFAPETSSVSRAGNHHFLKFTRPIAQQPGMDKTINDPAKNTVSAYEPYKSDFHWLAEAAYNKIT